MPGLLVNFSTIFVSNSLVVTKNFKHIIQKVFHLYLISFRDFFLYVPLAKYIQNQVQLIPFRKVDKNVCTTIIRKVYLQTVQLMLFNSFLFAWFQNIVLPTMVIALVPNMVTVVMHYFMVTVCGMGTESVLFVNP